MYRWLLLLLFPLAGSSQDTFQAATKIKAAALPAEIKFRGKAKEIWQWKDKLGNNILVLSILEPYQAKTKIPDEWAYSVELFAVHYVQAGSEYKTLWRLNDLVKECDVDHVADFIKGSTTITDLDKDSIAETKVQYKLACRGDVSPSDMKLIMHEDSLKYALRGSMWVWAGGDQDSVFRVTEKDVNLEKLPPVKEEDYEKLFGRYQTEKDFKNAPSSFLVFARKEWLKYAKESFEE
jgi:hypothetical protein